MVRTRSDTRGPMHITCRDLDCPFETTPHHTTPHRSQNCTTRYMRQQPGTVILPRLLWWSATITLCAWQGRRPRSCLAARPQGSSDRTHWIPVSQYVFSQAQGSQASFSCPWGCGASAVEKPAYWRMVHGRLQYIVAYGPLVNGKTPGASSAP